MCACTLENLLHISVYLFIFDKQIYNRYDQLKVFETFPTSVWNTIIASVPGKIKWTNDNSTFLKLLEFIVTTDSMPNFISILANNFYTSVLVLTLFEWKYSLNIENVN